MGINDTIILGSRTLIRNGWLHWIETLVVGNKGMVTGRSGQDVTCQEIHNSQSLPDIVGLCSRRSVSGGETERDPRNKRRTSDWLFSCALVKVWLHQVRKANEVSRSHTCCVTYCSDKVPITPHGTSKASALCTPT